MSEENQERLNEHREEAFEENESAVEWYIQVAEGKKAGPVSFERLKNFADRGKIVPKTKVRSTEPEAVWMSADAVPELFPNATSKDDVETMKDESAPDENSADESGIEGASSVSVEVTEDSQIIVRKPKIMIDVKKKKGEKPKEKKSEESSIVSSTGIKISLGGAAAKKEPKQEKSSAAFKFKIDPTASKKKEEKPEDKPYDAPTETESKEPRSEEKKETSSPEIKISIGAPTAKKKDEKNSTEKSAAAFKIAVKPGISAEPKVEEKKETDESTVITKKSQEKQGEKKKNTNDSTDFGSEKPKSGGGILKIVAVLSVILAFGGAIGLIVLGKETPGIPYSAVLAAIVFLYGIMTGIIAWSLNRIVSIKNE